MSMRKLAIIKRKTQFSECNCKEKSFMFGIIQIIKQSLKYVKLQSFESLTYKVIKGK